MRAYSLTVTEPSCEIDVIHETDVLVVGSGPGGPAAALAAARTGVRVFLVERFGCFGETSPRSGSRVRLVPPRKDRRGRRDRVGARATRQGDGRGGTRNQSLSYELDSEGVRLVADRMVEEAGIHAMLHRQFVAPLMDGDTIIGDARRRAGPPEHDRRHLGRDARHR